MITIKGEGGAIEIEVLGYENSAADNGSDANWLNSRICVSAGPFSGQYEAALSTQDLVDLQKHLGALLRDLRGKAEFRTDEDWLHFDIQMSALGTATVAGSATTRNGPKAALHFSFQTDQSHLSTMKRGLDEAASAFPVLQR